MKLYSNKSVLVYKEVLDKVICDKCVNNNDCANCDYSELAK